jgi:hypothetical protein
MQSRTAGEGSFLQKNRGWRDNNTARPASKTDFAHLSFFSSVLALALLRCKSSPMKRKMASRGALRAHWQGAQTCWRQEAD